jgi:hypothetical protein
VTVTPVRPHATDLHPEWCNSAVNCGREHRSDFTEIHGISDNEGVPLALISAVLGADGRRCVEVEIDDEVLTANGRIQVTAGNARAWAAALNRYADVIEVHPHMEARDVDAWLAAQAAEHPDEHEAVAA